MLRRFGKVPALVDGEQPLFESGAILLYLANKWVPALERILKLAATALHHCQMTRPVVAVTMCDYWSVTHSQLPDQSARTQVTHFTHSTVVHHQVWEADSR